MHSLDLRESIAESSNIRSDVLIHALQTTFLANPVVPKIRRGRQIEIVCIARQLCSESEGQLCLEVVYLCAGAASVSCIRRGTRRVKEREETCHGVRVCARDSEHEPYP